MSFHDVRFPVDISFGSSGGPEFLTDVVTLAGGKEQRNSNWQEARIRFDVSPGVKSRVQAEDIIAFFRARKGRAHGFRFKDWSDFQATTQNLGTGNGTVTNFQLVKKYTSGSTTETRTINKPVSGTVIPYLNGVQQSGNFSVDVTNGVIIFNSAPANGVVVTATFEFDVPVRFAEDFLPVALDNQNSFKLESIELIEVKL